MDRPAEAKLPALVDRYGWAEVTAGHAGNGRVMSHMQTLDKGGLPDLERPECRATTR